MPSVFILFTLVSHSGLVIAAPNAINITMIVAHAHVEVFSTPDINRAEIDQIIEPMNSGDGTPSTFTRSYCCGRCTGNGGRQEEGIRRNRSPPYVCLDAPSSTHCPPPTRSRPFQRTRTRTSALSRHRNFTILSRRQQSPNGIIEESARTISLTQAVSKVVSGCHIPRLLSDIFLLNTTMKKSQRFTLKHLWIKISCAFNNQDFQAWHILKRYKLMTPFAPNSILGIDSAPRHLNSVVGIKCFS
ncbi:hypothetical protein GGI42DRAFT_245194 [Trichoderma sp. SZMC 28013]